MKTDPTEPTSNPERDGSADYQEPNSKSLINSFGPALLVTAAFIGPGTVTAASKAGANYGYSLVWAVVFSALATIVLQEMAARLGIVSGQGLAQAIRNSVKQPLGRFLALTLVLGAILFGNSAYQTGNLVGASAGLTEIFEMYRAGESTSLAGEVNQVDDRVQDSPDSNSSSSSTPKTEPTSKGDSKWMTHTGVILFGTVALIVIWIGRLELVKWLMTGLVALMSLMFLCSAITSNPDWGAVAQGLVPKVPEAADFSKMLLFIVGLVGTTVVPYNLFLHASSAAEKWHHPKSDSIQRRTMLRVSFWDTAISVAIGGVVTTSILITMAVAFQGSTSDLTKLSQVGMQLEGSLGRSARVLFAIGLCAAGLSSAITAPIAAAYATAGCFQWPGRLADIRLKCVATAVVIVGVGVGVLMTSSPVQIIILAQVANGLLLPLVALFLLYVANQSNLLGEFKNGWLGNAMAGIVILVTFALAGRQLFSAFNKVADMFVG